MATPSSSATSPSPPIAYLSQASGTQQSTPTHSPNSHEKEERQKAVQKFLARAEIGMVTRALRARLSYASYKATNNIPHVSLRDLEAQTQSQSASFSRTIAAKRKAGVASNHYNNPATQGSTASAASSQRRGGSGAMAPPTSMASPRTHTPSSSIGSTAGYTTYSQVASNLRTGSQAPNLYSSILAPPPAKQARTIHNPSDPPVPAPTRPAPSPRVRTVKPSPKTDSQGKAKAAPKASKGTASPRHRRTNGASSIDKGKRKQTVDEPDVDMDGDVDMKAAATLTSLLMQHRPSMAGSVSSPRSSIDGSEVGSTYSHSQQHFVQSSARGSGPGHARNKSSMSSSSMSGVPTAPASSSNLAAEPPIFRHQTPPPHPQGVGGARTHTTPAAAAAPTDSEAANLMLFLATSPSPARPQTKDAKDIAVFRALGGGAGALRAKGRVLFPTGIADENAPRHGVALTRGGAGDSFTSSVSSIGGAMDGGGGDGNAASAARHASPAQLLPSAPLPASSAGAPTFGNPPRASADDGPPTDAEPQNSFNFQFHEFMGTTPPPPPGWYVPPPYGVSLNVEGSACGSGAAGRSSGGPAKSPRSPGRSPGAGATTTTTAHKQNLGLRADIGRKLFEEEQTRHAMATAAAAASSGVNAQQRSPALAAGIDLGRS